MTERVAAPSASNEYFQRLGEIAAVMLQSRMHRCHQIASLAIWVEPALLLEQVEVLYDADGVPLAFVSWACAAPDVLDRLVREPRTLLHISEWNEGKCLWIMDFACRRGHARAVAERIRHSVFADFDTVAYRGRRGIRIFRRARVVGH
jgi:hemolysin-activating ACP:hemolysin acyltransferase